MENGINALLSANTPPFPARDATVQAMQEARRANAATDGAARDLAERALEQRTARTEGLGRLVDTYA